MGQENVKIENFGGLATRLDYLLTHRIDVVEMLVLTPWVLFMNANKNTNYFNFLKWDRKTKNGFFRV